jgi:hypothetical protein
LDQEALLESVPQWCPFTEAHHSPTLAERWHRLAIARAICKRRFRSRSPFRHTHTSIVNGCGNLMHLNFHRKLWGRRNSFRMEVFAHLRVTHDSHSTT